MAKSKQEILEELSDRWLLKEVNIPIEFAGDSRSVIYELFNDGLVKRHKRCKLLLPDFQYSETVAIFSDYGGEDKNSRYYTYSFVFADFNGLGVFKNGIVELRKKYGLENPHKEISFKDAHYGQMARCMDEYLTLANNFVNGLVLTVAIDKKIISLTTQDDKKALKNVVESMAEYEYGNWKPLILEKSFRIVYILSYFIKLLIPSGKKIFWMPDEDATMANESRSKDITRMLGNALSSFKNVSEYDTIGFALKPFDTDESYYMTDILSIADLAAGSVEQYLTHAAKNDETLSELAEKVLQWHSVQGIGLNKLVYVIDKKNDVFNGSFLDIENEEYKKKAVPVDTVYRVNVNDTRREN